MKEYIERESAINAVTKNDCEGYATWAIKSIPAADVRPVVLCRDCKYNCGAKTWIDHEITADCTNGHGYPPLDWFDADNVPTDPSAEMPKMRVVLAREDGRNR